MLQKKMSTLNRTYINVRMMVLPLAGIRGARFFLNRNLLKQRISMIGIMMIGTMMMKLMTSTEKVTTTMTTTMTGIMMTQTMMRMDGLLIRSFLTKKTSEIEGV